MTDAKTPDPKRKRPGVRGRRRRRERPGGVEALEARALLAIAFAPVVSYQVGAAQAQIQSLDVGDVDGDGLPDVVTTTAPDADDVDTLLDRPDGTFAAPIVSTLTAAPARVALGAFREGGPLDLVTSAGYSGIAVAAGDGAGHFTPSVALGPTDYPYGVLAADATGDGKLDVLAADFSSGIVELFPGNGDGTFQAEDVLRTGGPIAVAVADVNGDGIPDIVAAQYENENVGIFLGEGGGEFAAPAFYPVTGVGSNSIAMVDLNHDGHPDIVTADQLSGDLSVLINRGDGTFAPATQVPDIRAANDVVAADLDGDGNPDLVVAGGDGVTVLPGRGDGTFGNPILLDAGARSDFVRVGDFDGDGRPDLAVATYNGTVDVLRNESPPSDAGSIQFSAPTFSVVEGVPVATVTVTRTGGGAGAVSARYRTSAGTAPSGALYQDVSGTIRFAAGDTTPRTFNVPILDDPGFQIYPDATVALTLSDPTGGAVLGTPDAALLEITDDSPRDLSVDDTTAAAPAPSATFTVSLSSPSGLPVTVTTQTIDGTAKGGVLYAGLGPITLTFAPGVTTQTVVVPILDDDVPAPGATFDLALSDPTNAVISRAVGRATIVDDEFATHLVLSTLPPAIAAAGSTFGLAVSAEDAEGAVDPGFGGVVSLELAAGPSGGSLGGTLTATAVAGVATFAGLTLDQDGPGYAIVATSAGLAPATSGPIQLDATTRSDFFGDGRDDFGVYGYQRFIIAEPSTGRVIEKAFGGPADVPVVGDFFGDGRDDLGVQGYQRYIVYDPATGQTLTQSFGGPEDVPVVGDFFGDGHDDFGVFG